MSDLWKIKKWEKTSHSWDKVGVDENGKIYQINNVFSFETEKQKFESRSRTRGLIRSIVVLIDLSERGLEPHDFTISRLRLISNEVEKFIVSFFDRNPISQIGIVGIFQGKGVLLSQLCGDSAKHIDVIKNINKITQFGEPSLQNGLNTALSLLSSAAKYSTKEILMIYGSLNTIDCNLDKTILSLKRNKVIVNIIGFGASVRILNFIAEQTNGNYYVPLNDEHFHELLMKFIDPPHLEEGFELKNFIPFCYPQPYNSVTFDISEIKVNRDAKPKSGGFKCGICGFVVFSIPTYCPSCGTLILTPPDITKTQLFLNPPKPFIETDESIICAGCNFPSSPSHTCPSCSSKYCSDCAKFISETLHFCPHC